MAENPNPKENPSSEELHEYVKTAVNKLGPDVSKERKKEHAKLLVKVFEKGMTPKEAMQISDEEVAELYSFAYFHFSAGKYEEAKEMFKMMLTLEPTNPDFATSLGICHHKLKFYEYALTCYMLGAFLDYENPVPLFYAYDCCVNLQDEASAAVMLSNVIARAGKKEAYAHIKNDAELRLDQLQKKLLDLQSLERQIGTSNMSA
ncbi:MAG TPA: SycD/LcrH family type III secretion system chaperone [Parachlamydiaceae bacterium]|nr:SycD/LcrH family type III secretion system chaperone [Parachlamydiaceae bacterium]